MEQMTLYFSRSTGEIKCYCTGIQDMSYFGEDETDYSQIWGFIVIDKDDFVINNRKMFKINLENDTLGIKSGYSISNYPVIN